jgi:hypothetical protein
MLPTVADTSWTTTLLMSEVAGVIITWQVPVIERDLTTAFETRTSISPLLRTVPAPSPLMVTPAFALIGPLSVYVPALIRMMPPLGVWSMALCIAALELVEE